MFNKIINSILLLASLNALSYAGQQCEPTEPDVNSVRMAFASAVSLQQQLNLTQPQVALIARVGQDLSKYNLSYSHMGFVVKDEETGLWRIKHLLNQCGTANGDLWQEGLANFFMDTPFTYQFMIIEPSKELQAKLLDKLKQPTRYRQVFDQHYNMLAYPFSTQYQNSNQWLLELLTQAAAEPITINNREQAQHWLQLMEYQPTRLNLGMMTRLGARMFKANVAFDDHPDELRFSGLIDTITVDSVRSFIAKVDPNAKVQEFAEVKLTKLPELVGL